MENVLNDIFACIAELIFKKAKYYHKHVKYGLAFYNVCNNRCSPIMFDLNTSKQFKMEFTEKEPIHLNFSSSIVKSGKTFSTNFTTKREIFLA